MGKQFEELEPKEDLYHPTKYEGGIKQFGKDIAKYEELTAEKERELFCKFQSGDMEAKKTLITSQSKLIRHICGAFKNDPDYEELVSSCITELVLKFDKFNPDWKASKPTSNTKKAKNYSRGRLCYFTARVVKSTIDAFLDHRKRTYGLVDPDGVHLHTPLTDWEEVPKQEEPEAHKNIDKELIYRMLDVLSSRKKKILSLREKKILAGMFGLKCEKCTLNDLGLRFGISSMKVWRIQQAALCKLKKHLCRNPGDVIKNYKKKG